jgi:cytochrome d ubiquinol oxidase subunit II
MLETLWLVLWGLLWAVYFMLDGFDLGMGMLHPFLTRDEEDKKTVYHAMGPFWDGNEVWLVAAGGVTFAAFPFVYAVLFSSLYSPLMIILFGLILRAVSIEFRELSDSRRWRSFFDGLLAVSSFIPAFLFGVVFSNLFRGIPIGEGGVFYGTVLSLFDVYGCAGGVLFVLLFILHGALWLAIKSEGLLRDRTASSIKVLWPLLMFMIAIFLVLTIFRTDLYANYLNSPPLFFLPFITVIALFLIGVFLQRRSWWKAWFLSSFIIVCITLSGVFGLHPNLILSSIDPAYSITIYAAASSPRTLMIMLVVVAIFLPIIICYQAWVHWLFREPVTEKDMVLHDLMY